LPAPYTIPLAWHTLPLTRNPRRRDMTVSVVSDSSVAIRGAVVGRHRFGCGSAALRYTCSGSEWSGFLLSCKLSHRLQHLGLSPAHPDFLTLPLDARWFEDESTLDS